MKQKFTSLVAFFSEADSGDLSGMTFDELCVSFNADPTYMDRMLYDDFGMSGDEIIEQLRKNTPGIY